VRDLREVGCTIYWVTHATTFHINPCHSEHRRRTRPEAKNNEVEESEG